MPIRLPKKKVDKAAAADADAVVSAINKADHLRAFRWKKGQSGNPLGKPPGSGSIVNWLKKRLAGAAFQRPDKYLTLAEELAHVILKQAKRGNYNFMHLLLEKAESRQLTEEELAGEVEKFFNVVTKYVHDPETRENIARDLGLLKDKKEMEE